MASKNLTGLAALFNLAIVEKGSPFGGTAAVGSIDGFPVSISWTQVQKQSVVAFLIKLGKGSLRTPPDLLKQQIASSPEVLAATGKKKLAGRDLAAISISDAAITFLWHYSFRAPGADAAVATLRALLSQVRDVSTPVGTSCEVCGRSQGEMYCVDSVPTIICAGCREQAGEEDRRRIEAYESRPSNPALGTIAGVGACVVMAIAWGGVAFALNRIFLFGAILIGVAVAWAVNKGMGKVNTYGRVLTFFLTIASVVLGDYVFILLSAAKELGTDLSAGLAAAVAERFFEIEYSDSSGYLNLLFGLLGAVYIVYTNRAPVAKRKMVPVVTTAS